MKKLLLTLAGSAAALALAPAAMAQTADNGGTIVITGSSGTFGDDTVATPTFTNTFTFTTPAGFNSVSATISSILNPNNPNTNLDFSSVRLNGTEFAINSTGNVEFRTLASLALVAGATNTLIVSGTAQPDASFSGTLTFGMSSAIPEPATWAFMLIGFGAVGYSMRKRPAYKLAQAV